MKNLILKLKYKLLYEYKFRKPRRWSNQTLKKIAPLFSGDIINVSGWRDEDKEGSTYKTYFTQAHSYAISNYTGNSGFQNQPNEIPLNLENELPATYTSAFDVVFNHTTLEHIFEIEQAFKNLCNMSRDIVIVIVPFLQEMHFTESYNDYWRFTPYTIKKLFEKNGMDLVFIDANSRPHESVYVLAVGTKKPNAWTGKFHSNTHAFEHLGEHAVGRL